jgi:hypothetical protein
VDPAVAGLVGAVIAGIVGLIGATLVRRTEHEKWLREKRLEAYASFLAAVDELTVGRELHKGVDSALDKELHAALAEQATSNLIQGVVRPQLTLEQADTIRHRLYDALVPFEQLERAVALVKLVGPPDLEGPLKTLRDQAFAISYGDRSDDDTARDALNDTYDKFIRQARTYLQARDRSAWPFGRPGRSRT